MLSKRVFAVAIFVLLIVAVGILSYQLYNNRQNLKRVSGNYITAIMQKRQAEILTKQEFSNIYTKLEELAKKLDIKPKNIKEVLYVNYAVKDTNIVTRTMRIDSVKHVYSFDVIQPFYTISGDVVDNKIRILETQFSDNLKVFVYNDREHWFWKLNKFWKPKYLTAKVWSEYKQDTVLIEKQLHIK